MRKHLNIGLKLKVSGVYKESDLRNRCKQRAAALDALERFLRKPDYLEHVDAKEAEARRCTDCLIAKVRSCPQKD